MLELSFYAPKHIVALLLQERCISFRIAINQSWTCGRGLHVLTFMKLNGDESASNVSLNIKFLNRA